MNERCFLSWVEIILLGVKLKVFLFADFQFCFTFFDNASCMCVSIYIEKEFVKNLYSRLCVRRDFFRFLIRYICVGRWFSVISFTKSNLESSQNDFRASHSIMYYNYYALHSSSQRKIGINFFIFTLRTFSFHLLSLQGQTFRSLYNVSGAHTR